MTLRAEVSEGLLSGLLGGHQECQAKLEADPREARMAASGRGGPRILPATWSALRCGLVHMHIHLPPRGASDTLLGPHWGIGSVLGTKAWFSTHTRTPRTCM